MRTGSADAVSASTTADAHRPLQLARNCVSLNSRLKMFKGFKNLGTCTLYISVFRLVSVLIDVQSCTCTSILIPGMFGINVGFSSMG